MSGGNTDNHDDDNTTTRQQQLRHDDDEEEEEEEDDELGESMPPPTSAPSRVESMPATIASLTQSDASSSTRPVRRSNSSGRGSTGGLGRGMSSSSSQSMNYIRSSFYREALMASEEGRCMVDDEGNRVCAFDADLDTSTPAAGTGTGEEGTNEEAQQAQEEQTPRTSSRSLGSRNEVSVEDVLRVSEEGEDDRETTAAAATNNTNTSTNLSSTSPELNMDLLMQYRIEAQIHAARMCLRNTGYDPLASSKDKNNHQTQNRTKPDENNTDPMNNHETTPNTETRQGQQILREERLRAQRPLIPAPKIKLPSMDQIAMPLRLVEPPLPKPPPPPSSSSSWKEGERKEMSHRSAKPTLLQAQWLMSFEEAIQKAKLVVPSLMRSSSSSSHHQNQSASSSSLGSVSNMDAKQIVGRYIQSLNARPTAASVASTGPAGQDSATAAAAAEGNGDATRDDDNQDGGEERAGGSSPSSSSSSTALGNNHGIVSQCMGCQGVLSTSTSPSSSPSSSSSPDAASATPDGTNNNNHDNNHGNNTTSSSRSLQACSRKEELHHCASLVSCPKCSTVSPLYFVWT